MRATSVIIADDHEIIREGLRNMLQRLQGAGFDTEFTVVGEATNGIETVTLVKQHKPHILLLDITMPLASGEEVLLDIRRWSPDTKIIVFTAVTSPRVLAGLVDAGVEGIFAKGGATDELATALPVILRGGRHIAKDIMALMDTGPDPLAVLTPRERQILTMIIHGKTNPEMAQQLSISPKTVDKHRTSLMAKLDLHSVSELIAWAAREGLIASQQP